MKKIVCFDLGAVLVWIAHTWQEAAQIANVSIQASIPNPWSRSSNPDLLAFEAGQISYDVFIERLAQTLGISTGEARAVQASVLQWFRELLREYNPTHETLLSRPQSPSRPSCQRRQKTTRRSRQTIPNQPRCPGPTPAPVLIPTTHLTGRIADGLGPQAFTVSCNSTET